MNEKLIGDIAFDIVCMSDKNQSMLIISSLLRNAPEHIQQREYDTFTERQEKYWKNIK